MQLRVNQSAKKVLLLNGIHREWGARPLRRMIQSEIENQISTKFLTGEFVDNATITVKSKNKELDFSQVLKKTKTIKSKKSKPAKTKSI